MTLILSFSNASNNFSPPLDTNGGSDWIKNLDPINTCCPGLSKIFPLTSFTFPARIKLWAQSLILAGKVKDVNGKILDKPGQQVLIGSKFFIQSEPPFVSRGGEKLLEAFEKLNIKVKGKVCIDAGISTGGFTDCLLQQGAKLVYA